MQHLPLDTIAERLSKQLRCEQEGLCLQIIRQVTRGKPVASAALQTALQVSRDELEHRLTTLPDTEFDGQDNIVGWGVTLVPTRHRFHIDGKLLFTWCAFDTVLFPPSLGTEAQIHSRCPVTGHPITFVATPEETIKDLAPPSSVMSLIIAAE